MPIDSSIYGNIQPYHAPDQLNQLAKVMQIQGAQRENQLGQLKMDEYQRGLADTNALNTLYQGALGADGKIDRNALYTGAAKSGLGSKIPALQKGFMEADKGQAEVDEKTFKLAKERHDIFKSTLGALANEPGLSKDLVIQAGQSLVQQGILPAELFQKSMASMPDDPMQLRQRLIQGVKSQMTPEQMFTVFAPKPEKMDNGQQISFRDTNPNSPTYGQETAGGVVQKVTTPDAVLSASTSTENNKRSVSASLANAAATREVAGATRDAANVQTGFQNEQGLRKEFEGLPEVKSYKQAYPAYAAIKDAASRSTPQSDINIVYGIAKLYDPNSVVREGEYATVANSPAIPERIKGYAQYIAGGGKLSAETKRQILAEAESRIQSYEAEHNKARASYEGIAKRRGIDPANVFQATGDVPMGGQSPSKPTAKKPIVTNW